MDKQLKINSAFQMTHLINIAKKLCFKLTVTSVFSIKKTIALPLIISILAVTSGCQSSDKKAEVEVVPNELVSLQSAKSKWSSNSGQYYTIQSQRICECLSEVSAQMNISVLDNSLLSAVDIVSDEVISQEIQEEIPTVEDIFSLIEKAIADGISIDVTYNEEYGYPEMTKIDVEQLAVDGGLHITLSNLDLQDSKSALDDVTWTLKSFDSIAGPKNIIESTHVSLSIDLENRQLGGIGGCNAYGADFVLDDENHNMTISNVFSTQMWCEEPENVMLQEQDFFATLAKVRFFTFDKTTLKLVVGGDAGLHFIAAQNSVDEPEVDNASSDFTSLQNARKKWDSNPKQHYTIQTQRNCFCLPEMTEQMKISVLNNTVLSAVNISSGDVISKEIQEEILTVDTLFTLIERAIADDVSIEITYNEEYGYPETTKIDLEQLAADGGLHITLSNFELLASKLALDDVTWVLESFDNIAGPQPVIKNTHLTLSVDMESMLLTGSGGCNSYSADFVLDDETHDITISNVVSTEMWCSEPDSVMQQEENYFATLEQVRFFTLNKATLYMGVGADAGLHFVVAD